MSADTKRNVVVTGAGRGLGRVLASLFCQAEYRVFACDLDPLRLEQLAAELPSIEVSQLDVSRTDGVAEFFTALLAHIPGIDVLVNNVGIAGPQAPLEEIDQDEWLSTLHVNLCGAVWCSQHALRSMKNRSGGAIINVSTASVRTVPAFRSPYVVAKAGLESLTRAIAREAGPFGVRCNAVQPGAMDTERLQEVLARVADRMGTPVAAVEQKFLEFVSMRTKVSPMDVAELILFLASDAARHITGQIIAVDGGVEWEA